jgi:hypothetical protein
MHGDKVRTITVKGHRGETLVFGDPSDHRCWICGRPSSDAELIWTLDGYLCKWIPCRTREEQAAAGWVGG